MKKILFFIPTLMHGGAEKVLVNLVNNLDPQKYEITVHTIFDKGVNKQYLNQNIHYKFFSKHIFRGISTIFQLFSPEFLYKNIIKEEYDIVVSYLEGPTARIISGCPYKNSKKYSWIHTEFLDSKQFSHSFRNFDEAKKCYQSFDYNICVSESVKNSFENISTLKNTKVLYNTNESEKIIEKSNETVDDVQFNHNVLNICSVGKIVHIKGYDRLLNVHKKLLEEGYNQHIYLIGIGEQQSELEKYIEENELTNSVTFLGFKDNPYKYMAQCDLYVCSSRREGFSTAVTESLIIGCPVVSTNCSGAYELLGSNNEYGIVTENSTEGIYEGVKHMISDSKTLMYYREMSQLRGKDFQKEKTVHEVEKIFDL